MIIRKFAPLVFMNEDDGAGSGSPSDDSADSSDQDAGAGKSPDHLERELKKVRAEAAKYRTQNKELAEKAARLDELEGTTKSDLEKLAEKATTAEQRAQAAEQRALRLEIAADKGIPKRLIDRMRGSTQEELEADADELLELLGQKARPPGRVAENLRPAGGGDEPPEETDPAKLAAAVPRY